MSGQAVPMSMCLSLEKKKGPFSFTHMQEPTLQKKSGMNVEGGSLFSSTREAVKTLGQSSRWENGAVWIVIYSGVKKYLVTHQFVQVLHLKR